MKLTRIVFSFVFAVLCVGTTAQAQTTAFTYQGKLTDGGNPANGNYDLQLALFDSASGGTQVASTQINAVTVSSGAFTVSLDFGAGAFPGANRWLEISARLSGAPTFTTLSPRQPITATPYAVRSLNASAADTANNASQLGGVAASQYVQTTDSRLSDARAPTAGSDNYIQNTTSQQSNSNFNISGNGIVNGRIGVGTNTPVSKLDVRGNMSIGVPAFVPGLFGANSLFVANDDGGDPNNYFRMDGSGDTLYIVAASQPGATKGAGITFRTATAGQTEVDSVTISPAGNVGIGTAATTSKLSVDAGSGVGVVSFSTGANGIGIFGSNNENGLAGRFDGNVAIFAGKLSVSTLGTAGSASLCRNVQNEIAICSSSLRYKTNVQPFGGSLDTVRQLRPIRFNWKESGQPDVGLGAEDVAKVAPLFVSRNDKGEVEGVKYERLTLLLINAIKEQQTRIDLLQQANSALNARLRSVERRLRKGVRSARRRH